MKQVFFAIASEFSSDSRLLETLWKEIEKHYCHKSRHYHNWDHLENMFQRASDSRPNVKDWEALVFAIFYHDLVYNVLKADNEEKSAALANKRLTQLQFPQDRRTLCIDHILATKRHEWSINPDTNLLLDADLSILGADWPAYQKYSEQVRKEYAIYPDLIYKPGRKKVLLKFLERDSIFKTPDFKAQFETQARHNIQQEMDRL